MNDSIENLRSLSTIRERSSLVYELAQAGKTHFVCHDNKLDEVADFVIDVTKRHYPDLNIPFHCRLNHLNAGGVDRTSHLDGAALFDLIMVSVLLDAGAGDKWSIDSDGVTYSRSEGLAVASVILAGDAILDANYLQQLTLENLKAAFDVRDDNPLVGCEGRLALLHRLGEVLAQGGYNRPSDLISKSFPRRRESSVDNATAIMIPDIFSILLDVLSPIWPSRLEIDGVPMGDVWEHPAIGLVPFHKLTQWLTYSLIDPIKKMGFEVSGVEQLTGLPEYRNGGLLLDSGLISLRDSSLADEAHEVSSSLIIEWRALTVVYLDKIAQRVREKLGFDETEFPLAKVLEGGTWNAGRKLAQSRGGLPPLNIISDGTVF